jgi:hypothetical protein
MLHITYDSNASVALIDRYNSRRCAEWRLGCGAGTAIARSTFCLGWAYCRLEWSMISCLCEAFFDPGVSVKALKGSEGAPSISSFK